MHNIELEKLINMYLDVEKYQDYVPNGLQVEGRSEVKKILTGVTASQALLDEGVKLFVDAIIVHHGFFWKNESDIIVNIKRKRLKTLLCNDINLYGYHLPLDVHPIIGNNVKFGELLEVEIDRYILPLLPMGHFLKIITPDDLMLRLSNKLKRQPLYVGRKYGVKEIRTVAWCTGSGQNFIQAAGEAGADAFITGEVSEQTIHIAREMGIHFYAAGHHATERSGIKMLGKWLQKDYNFSVCFIDIPNPA
ncbi:Nif3-like dinuclear metal center hexameric protein [Arsenophonus symbiont of Ornithomya chloropus]|uniref:Nif3-like dinuclear metal center hexameric protein n=1 Tax=Arsenophonus symbiont of Ornithomya chloropus TaxID=634121 RepID=UPI0032B24F6A